MPRGAPGSRQGIDSDPGVLMAQDDPKTLVSTAWLAAHLKDPDLRVIDASWHMPAENRDARAEYDAGHIPGARLVTIPGWGHDLPVELIDRVATEIAGHAKAATAKETVAA